MNFSALRRIVCGALLTGLGVGCASAPPPAPVSDLRQQATRAEVAARQEYLHRNWAAAALLFQRAADHYAVLDDFDARASALHNQAQALRHGDRIATALEVYEQALRLNEARGRLTAQAENLVGVAQCHVSRDERARALDTLEAALHLATGSPTVTATVQNDLALLLLQRGAAADRARIIDLLEAALRVNETRRTTPHSSANQLNLGRAWLQFADLDRAQARLDQALTGFRAVDDPLGLAHTHEALGHLWRARGDAARAAEHFQLARAKFAFLKDDAGLRRLENSAR